MLRERIGNTEAQVRTKSDQIAFMAAAENGQVSGLRDQVNARMAEIELERKRVDMARDQLTASNEVLQSVTQSWRKAAHAASPRLGFGSTKPEAEAEERGRQVKLAAAFDELVKRVEPMITANITVLKSIQAGTNKLSPIRRCYPDRS